MLSEKLELLLTANAGGAISELQNFSKEADRSLSSAQSKFEKFASTATKIGAGGLGIGGLLTSLGSSEQAASQQLDAAISTAGQSVDDFKGRINSTISTMEGFDHSAVDTQNALNVLVGAYGDTGKALDEMQLVADLAARKHESLADAATQVAKAHGGAARLFKEFNIQVGQNADGTKNYDGALTDLAQKLQGQASAASNTFMGHVKALGMQLEDTAASFGEKYGPGILGVSAVLTAAGPIVSSAASKVQALRAARLAEAEAADGEAASTGLLSMALGPAGLVGAIGIGIGALALFGSSMNDNSFSQQELAGWASKSADEIQALAAAMVAADTETKGTIWDKTVAHDNAQAYDDAIQKLEGMGDAGVGTLVRLRDAAQQTGDQGFVDKLNKAIDDAKTKQDNLNTSQDQGAAAMGKTKNAAKDLSTAYDKIRSSADNAFNATLRLASTDVRVQQGALSITDAQSRLTDANNKLIYLKAAGASQDDINKALEEQKSAQLSLTQANLDEADAIAQKDKEQQAANGHLQTALEGTNSYLDALKFVNQGLTGPTHDAINQYIWDVTVARDKTEEWKTSMDNVFGGGPLPGLGGGVPYGAPGFPTAPTLIGPPLISPPPLIGPQLPPQGPTIGQPGPQQHFGEAPIIQHIYGPTDPYAQQQAAMQERAKARYLSSSGR